MKRLFRKSHRFLAPIVALPILLTVITGILITMIREWSIGLGVPASILLKIHTGEFLHLEAIYPLLNGVGLLGLLVTGLSMTGIFGKKPRRTAPFQQ